MDYNAMAQQLIDAVTAASNAEVKALDVKKGNEFATINNQANANGTLYSTQPGFKKTAYIGSTYEPAVAAAKLKPLTTKMEALSQATSIARSIDSMNRAANELNKIVFDY